MPLEALIEILGLRQVSSIPILETIPHPTGITLLLEAMLEILSSNLFTLVPTKILDPKTSLGHPLSVTNRELQTSQWSP